MVKNIMNFVSSRSLFLGLIRAASGSSSTRLRLEGSQAFHFPNDSKSREIRKADFTVFASQIMTQKESEIRSEFP